MSNTQKAEPTLSEMAALGMQSEISHPHPCGQYSTMIKAEDVPAYCADPVAFWARHHGVSKADYLAWHDTGYNVQCATIRKNGKRCRNIVDNGHAVGSPKDWAYLQGSICHVHAEL